MTERPSHLGKSDSPQSQDWEALARHLTSEDTAESRAHVEALLREPAERGLIAALGDITGGMAADIPSDIDVESALIQVKARMNATDTRSLKLEGSARDLDRSRKTTWRIPFPAIAAAGLVAVGLGAWLTVGRGKSPGVPAANAPRMVATGVGTRDSLQLSDGTRIVIGPQSSVKVAAGYGSSNREVEIRGDAYFEVVHDASRPFTVHTANATVQDIGTKFAIRSDAAEGVGVTVTEGSVSLAPLQSASPPVVLRAGDRGTLDPSGKVVTRRGAATGDDMAWLTGRLVFRESPISEVVSSMRRWYGIELQLADPSLSSRHLTATFTGEPADRVLEVLSLALGADIERHGDTAVVRSIKGRVR